MKIDINEVEFDNVEDISCKHFDGATGNAFTERTFN